MEETLKMVSLVSSGTKVGNDWRKPRAGGSRNWWLHCGFGSNSRWSEKRTLWQCFFFSNGNIGWTVAHWPPWVLFSFVFNNCMNVLLNKTLMCNFRSVGFYNCKLFMLSSNNAGPIFCNYSFPTKYNICQHRLSGLFHENAKIPRSPKGALSTSHRSGSIKLTATLIFSLSQSRLTVQEYWIIKVQKY